MSRYKCIPLPFFFNSEDPEIFFEFGRGLIERYTKIEPIFNRYGMYLDRLNKMAWIETVHGCWKLDKVDEFHHSLYYISNVERILHPKIAAAIGVLIREKICPKGLKHLHYEHNAALGVRHTYREAMKRRINKLGK